MGRESAIIEKVETFVRHPVFSGSDKALESVLDELEDRAGTNEISQETLLKLRALILASPHLLNN
jgi:hypothetical protein